MTDYNEDHNQLEPVIDITIPRECIYKVFEDAPGPCPRCGAGLQQSSQTYLIATRHGRNIADQFMIGSDFGWFCPNCPTVVINPHQVKEFLSFGKSGWDIGSEFGVMGIIDLDAVPPDKRNIPLGDDDNPIPLVEFANVTSREGAGSKQLPGRSSKSHTRRKRPKPTRLQTKQKKKKKKRRRR
jgi:hypothetical protein